MASYYDIDDILTEEDVAPVLFHKAANGVTIDPSAETNCVEQGTKVELPFWLAHRLHLRQAVSISLPACFDQKLEIQADAACVDLRLRCPNFYEFGCKLLPLVTDRTIGILLSTAFKIRYKERLTKVYTAAHITASKFLPLLTKEETNQQLWVLNSVPGEVKAEHSDGEVEKVLQTLQSLPSPIPSRKWLVDHMVELGFSRSLSE